MHIDEGAGAGSKLGSLVRSRRFWVALAGVTQLLLHDLLGVPEDVAEQLVLLAGAWVVGDSIRRTE